jgi:phage-related protein
VREWLKDLPVEVKKAIGADINLVQWQWPTGKPLVDGFSAGLFEVRTGVLFCLDGATMVLLHGFEKKTQKTPKSDLDLTRRRMKS